MMSEYLVIIVKGEKNHPHVNKRLSRQLRLTRINCEIYYRKMREKRMVNKNRMIIIFWIIFMMIKCIFQEDKEQDMQLAKTGMKSSRVSNFHLIMVSFLMNYYDLASSSCIPSLLPSSHFRDAEDVIEDDEKKRRGSP